MSMANNDPNWRVAASTVDIAPNTPVYIMSDGTVAKANPAATASCAIGIVPHTISAGNVAPIIRQGKLSGLASGTAGDAMYLAADGTISASPAANPNYTQRLGYICGDDTTCMFISIQEDAIAQTPS